MHELDEAEERSTPKLPEPKREEKRGNEEVPEEKPEPEPKYEVKPGLMA